MALRAYVALLFVLFSAGRAIQDRASTVWVLDDFEDGNLEAVSGMSWIVIADDLAGGHTIAQLEIRGSSSADSRHALRLAGTLGQGTSSFAGAWLPLERSGRNLDVSAFDGVRLRVKGPAPLDIGFRVGVVNFMARVEAGPEWKTIEIPFTALAPRGKAPDGMQWDPTAAQVFGVTTPQASGDGRAAGDVAFEIDDVSLYATRPAASAPIASGNPTGLAVVPFIDAAAIPSIGWIDLGADPERDGKVPALPDATRLEAIPGASNGMLWVRVSLREAPHDRWMGLNLALDVDGNPDNGFAWWGSNTSFKFDQLVTVWCFRVAAGCQGYVGLGSAAQAAAGTFVAGGAERLRVAIDRERRAFVVGIDRAALDLERSPIRLVAAVGSALLYADDVPDKGAAVVR